MNAGTLILPVHAEFLERLHEHCGNGLFADLKRKLMPAALDMIRLSLLEQAHPLEVQQSLSDLHCQDMIENPQGPPFIDRLLDEISGHPKVQATIEILKQPAVLQRLRVEWLHELTVGRFEQAVPYLYNEDKLVEEWKQFCGTLRDLSINPFAAAEQELNGLLARLDVSESARKLYRLSFLAACRKLFVVFTDAKETWLGSYTLEEFQLQEALAGTFGTPNGSHDSGRFSIRFGLVGHVYYVAPSLERLNLYLACLKNHDLVATIQTRLCPFVSGTSPELNFNLLAEIFYHVYLPGRVREFNQPGQPVDESEFLEKTGIKPELYEFLRFTPLAPETASYFSTQIQALPRLKEFLHHPRTVAGLLRRRLYRTFFDYLMAEVTQKILLSLCRQWNPLVRTSDGTTLFLADYADGKVTRVAGSEAPPSAARDRILFEELLLVLFKNTQEWQSALKTDSYVVDRERVHFMTVLNQAIEESSSEETRKTRYLDTRRVACVVLE